MHPNFHFGDKEWFFGGVPSPLHHIPLSLMPMAPQSPPPYWNPKYSTGFYCATGCCMCHTNCINSVCLSHSLDLSSSWMRWQVSNWMSKIKFPDFSNQRCNIFPDCLRCDNCRFKMILVSSSHTHSPIQQCILIAILISTIYSSLYVSISNFKIINKSINQC